MREGQDVREGDVIARIDTRNLQAQYDRELAAVEQGARRSRSRHAQSRQEPHAARAALHLAEHVRGDRERLRRQRRQLQARRGAGAPREDQSRRRRRFARRSPARSPSGMVQPGEKVSPDSTIVTLVDLRQMVLEAAVPAAEIPSVRIGQTARFKVGGFGDARIRRRSAAHQSDDRGRLARDHDLHRRAESGPRAEGRHVRAGRADAGHDRSRCWRFRSAQCTKRRACRYVYTLRDDKIVRTTVTLGAAAPRAAFVEVREGLAAGDRVIVADIGDARPARARSCATNSASSESAPSHASRRLRSCGSPAPASISPSSRPWSCSRWSCSACSRIGCCRSSRCPRSACRRCTSRWSIRAPRRRRSRTTSSSRSRTSSTPSTACSNIYATAREGRAFLQIDFRLDVDIVAATQEVRDKVAQIRAAHAARGARADDLARQQRQREQARRRAWSCTRRRAACAKSRRSSSSRSSSACRIPTASATSWSAARSSGRCRCSCGRSSCRASASASTR